MYWVALILALSAPGPGSDSSSLVTVGRFEVRGRLLDPRRRLMKVIAIRPGSKWKPDSLLAALDILKSDLDRLGYDVTVRETWHGTRVDLDVHLSPAVLVRYVYVRGNWPMFAEDILKHVRFRSGSRLPPPGERQQAFNRQRQRILDYLRSEGYFDGDVEIVVDKTDKPYLVDLRILLRPLWEISPLWPWNPNVYYLGKLTVMGNTAMSSEKIRSFFVHKVVFYEKPFSVRRFRKDLERLKMAYRKLGYIEVRIRHDFHPSVSLDRKTRRVNIQLNIREGRRYTIRFVGSRKKRHWLLKNITLLKEGTADPYELAESARSLERAFQKDGYLEARVVPRRRDLTPKESEIVFYVWQGPQLKVRKVEFRGNRSFSASRLKKLIKTKKFPAIGVIGLGAGGFVSARQLSQDIERLYNFYRRHGYRYARVWASIGYDRRSLEHPAAVSLEEAFQGGARRRGWITVRFAIDEGRQVRVVRRTVQVSDPKLARRFRKALKLKVGAPFSEEALAADLKRIKRICADLGHPYVKVAYEAKPSKDRTGVELAYRVDPGPLVRFGEVFVRGNLKTSRHIITRELSFHRGDSFGWAKVEESRKNLASLGIFKSVRITFIGLKDRRKVVHALVDVSERYNDHGTLELGVGSSTDNLWFVSFMYENRNLFGWGKQFQVSGEWGQIIQKGRLTYRDPRPFGWNIILDLTGFIRNEDTVRLGQLLTYGLSFSVIKRFSERLQLYLRYQLKRIRRRESLYRTGAAPDEAELVDVYTNTASLGPTIIWDRRDNPLLPKKGFYLTGSVRWVSRYLLADLLPAADFLHFRISGQLFWPLPLGIVIAQGVRYDHALPLGQTVMIPKTERFYAGGDTTVRGYELDQLFTTIVKVPMAPVAGGEVYRIVPVGGNIRLIYNLEIQFPIWKHSFLFGLPIWGAIFMDAGSLANSFGGLGLKKFFTDFRHSMGAAVRLMTPVGAISFAYAVPFEPSYGTSPTGRVHFNFGFIF